jgi:hypothetical protein
MCKEIRINPLKAELNPICQLLALLGAHHILHVSSIRVKVLGCRVKICRIRTHTYIRYKTEYTAGVKTSVRWYDVGTGCTYIDAAAVGGSMKN